MNTNYAYDYVDEALASWDRIKTEGVEAKRQVELNHAKGALPFSEPLAIEICERVSSGELLIDGCLDERLPTVRRTLQWLKESPEFAALYKDSISDRLTIFEEEVIKIADDAASDFRDVVRHGRPTRVLDGDAIARAKLRVEVRLKHLKAFKPSICGEQSTLGTYAITQCVRWPVASYHRSSGSRDRCAQSLGLRCNLARGSTDLVRAVGGARP